jgi:hypothetical protein
VIASESFSDLAEQVAPQREGSGRLRLRTAERAQVALRAVSLDDLLAADRLVWRFVEELGLSPLYGAIERRPAAGRVVRRRTRGSW